MAAIEQGQPDPNAEAFKAPVEGAMQTSAAGAEAQGNEFDHLFGDAPLTGSVEAAAVRPDASAVVPSVETGQAQTAAVEAAARRTTTTTLPPAQTSHRAGYWKPATPDQIANAKKYGFDLQANNDRYYS